MFFFLLLRSCRSASLFALFSSFLLPQDMSVRSDQRGFGNGRSGVLALPSGGLFSGGPADGGFLGGGDGEDGILLEDETPEHAEWRRRMLREQEEERKRLRAEMEAHGVPLTMAASPAEGEGGGVEAEIPLEEDEEAYWARQDAELGESFSARGSDLDDDDVDDGGEEEEEEEYEEIVNLGKARNRKETKEEKKARKAAAKAAKRFVSSSVFSSGFCC